MSFVLYYKVMEREEEQCWHLLEDSAESVNNEIRMTFQDNRNTLRLEAESMIEQHRFEPDQIEEEHLEHLRENTFFTRIDIIYPDNTIFRESGEKKTLRDGMTFEKIVSKGEHISARMTDSDTGNESVYYAIPLVEDGEARAILTGVVDLKALSERINPTIYDGQAACCVVDSSNGDFILDNWHEELGNAFNTPDRKRVEGYEDVDLKSEVKSHKTGVIAFESRTNGLTTYMYYTPVGIFDWQLLVLTQEDVIFENLLYLKKLLIMAGAVEAVLLVIYFLWTLNMVRKLTESQEETTIQLERSNTLIQCVTELSSDKDVDKSIENLLEIINDYFQSDRAHIFELDSVKKVFHTQYEYAREGFNLLKYNMPEIPLDCISKAMEAFEKCQAYYISNIDTEKGSMTYDILKDREIERMLAVPLWENGYMAGFVSVDNPKRYYDDASLLSSIQFFIADSLAEKKQNETLQFMSYRDMLTDLYNRNKYMQILEDHRQKILTDMGVAYIDLNGLKIINDQQGHKAGDELIQKAAMALKDIFGDDAYRIGGDEFVVICQNVDEEQFKQKIKQLEDNMGEKQVSISMGVLWQSFCDDLECMLKMADQHMYEAKEKHYADIK